MHYKFETDDEFEAGCLLKAMRLQIQLDALYNDVLRQYVKYGVKADNTELNPAESELIEEIRIKIFEHFEGLYSNEA